MLPCVMVIRQVRVFVRSQNVFTPGRGVVGVSGALLFFVVGGSEVPVAIAFLASRLLSLFHPPRSQGISRVSRTWQI